MEYLLVLLMAALIVMETSWFQHFLERRLIAGLENATGCRVEVGAFRFRPWLFQITLQKLVIHGTEPAGEPPLVLAREVDASVSPAQLLHRHLRVRHLDVVALEAHVRTNRQGVSNLPSLGGQSSPQESLTDLMDLSIGRLTVSHSVLYWNDRRQPMELEARDLALLLRMTRGRYIGAISSSGTTVRSGYGSPPPISFNSRFELSSTNLVLSPAAWQMQGMTGEASVTITPFPVLQVSGSFHGSADIPALARILHTPELRAGAIQFEGLAAYQDGSVSAQGRAQVRQLAVSSPGLPSLSLDATTSYAFQKNQLSLSNVQVSVWGGTVQGTLQANLEGAEPKFHLHSQLHHIRLDNALLSERTPPLVETKLHPAAAVDGALNAEWSGKGSGLKADFDLALQGPADPLHHELPVSGVARGTFEDGRGVTFHLTEADLRTPHSHVRARGTLAQRVSAVTTADPLVFDASTDDFNELRPFFQALVAAPSGIPLELQSQAEFSGQLSGSYEDPNLQGRVRMGQFRYHGWTWDRLTAVVALNSSSIQISECRVDHDKSSFELNAAAQLEDWRVTPESTLRFSARAQKTPIEGLKAAVKSDLPLRGAITGHLDAQGTTTDLTGSGVLRIDSGAIADEPFDSFSTQLRVSKSVWSFQDIELRRKRGRLSGEVTLEPDRSFVSGKLAGEGFHLADARRLAMPSAGASSKGGLDGTFGFDVSGSGTPEDMHFKTTWHLQNLAVGGTLLGAFNGTLTGEGKRLSLEGHTQSGEGSFRFRAQTTAGGDWPMEAEGEYASLRADPWIRAFFNREFAAAVTLGGTFRAAGPLHDPARIGFQSHTQDAAIDFPSLQWRNAQPIDTRYEKGQLTINRFIMRGPSTELAIAGGVRLGDTASLAIDVEGTANATLLTVFDPTLQASGRSQLHLRLTGTPSHPAVKGSMAIEDMSLGYGDLPFRFSNMQGTIDLSGERAEIRSLRGTSGGGGVNLSGYVTLTESPRFEVRAELSQVRMRYPAGFTSVLDGNLRFGGGVEQAQLQGELVVRQMALNENVNVVTKFLESSNPMGEAPAAPPSSLASKIRLNVRVTSSPPVQLQTPGFRLTGDIDIRLQGDLANPVQVGSIHLLRGEAVFRGNRYTLGRGDLNMTNPFRTQLYVDMEIYTQVQTYNLTMDISGPTDRLKFAYRSDPPLPTSDILSLLALGYVKTEGAYSATSSNPAASIGATAVLSQALSSEMTGRIQHLFGVSRIKIDPNVGVPGYGSGARVTVEQQVTRDLTLTYVTDTSYSQYRVIQFTWNINDMMSLMGIRDQNGIFGLEVRFRHRFK